MGELLPLCGGKRHSTMRNFPYALLARKSLFTGYVVGKTFSQRTTNNE